MKRGDSCSSPINKSQEGINGDVSRAAHTRKDSRKYNGNGRLLCKLRLMGLLHLVLI